MDLKRKIVSKEALIGIIGFGYVGLPLAREFLNKDFRVLGLDTDVGKVDKINRGESYISYIPGEFIRRSVLSGRLAATDDFSRLKETDVVLICVPTPLGRHNEPDLSYVLKTTEAIASKGILTGVPPQPGPGAG